MLKEFKPEEATLDLPDVNDIPGSNLYTYRMELFDDSIISSADEEGENIFDEDH